MFLIRNKRENMWILNERGNITTDSKDTKNIIREYYEQLYLHNFSNLGKIDKFVPKLTQ